MKFNCENLDIMVYEAFPDSHLSTQTNITLEQDKVRNFGWRPDGMDIDSIVIGGSRDFDSAHKTFSAYRGLSVHFIVDNIPREDGTVRIMQEVDPSLRAWFAGTSPMSFMPKEQISLNDNAVSIWLINDDNNNYSFSQLNATATLAKCLIATYEIPNHKIYTYTDYRIESNGQYNRDEMTNTEHIIYPMKELSDLGVGFVPEIPAELEEVVISKYADKNDLTLQCVKSQLYGMGYIFDLEGHKNGTARGIEHGTFGDVMHSMIKQINKHYNPDAYIDYLQKKELDPYARMDYTTVTQYIVGKLLHEQHSTINLIKCDECYKGNGLVSVVLTGEDSAIFDFFFYEDLDN